MRRTLATIGMLGAMAAGGCVHDLDTPAHFVPVDRADMGPYEKRAISADGVVIGLRRQSNPRKGTLEFWSEAIGNELATGRGYRLVKSEDVRNAAGTPGRLSEFATDYRGTTFTYLLAVYVTDGDVVLAEAGGKAESLRKRAADIRQCLLTAR